MHWMVLREKEMTLFTVTHYSSNMRGSVVSEEEPVLVAVTAGIGVCSSMSHKRLLFCALGDVSSTE